MHLNRFQSFLQLLVLLFFMFLVKPVFAQNFRDAPFWTVPTDTRQCIASFQGIGPFSKSRNLVRQDWPNDDGVNFNAHLGMMFSQAIGGRNIREFKAFLLAAAQADAYTIPVHQSGSWSPIYIQSNLIRLVAMSIIFLESRGQLSSPEKNILIAWGNKMMPGQSGTRNNTSSDSLLASGTAMLAWGNITKDNRLMRTGYQQFMKGFPYVLDSIGNLKRHPGHRGISESRLSLEDEYNVALQHAVEGAAILRNLGLDVFSTEIRGRNLHQAVAWWATVLSNPPANFQGYRAWSHNFHVAWIPIYLRFHPEQQSAARLHAIARDVTAGRRPSFRASSLGGSTDCLW